MQQTLTISQTATLTQEEKENLHKEEVFRQTFYRLQPYFRTSKAAYEWLEDEHKTLFLQRRFRDYEHFNYKPTKVAPPTEPLLTELEKENLHKADVFRSTYYRLLPYFKTTTGTYQWLEAKHVELYRHKKYSTYESFRRSYKMYLEKIRRSKGIK